MNEVEPQLVVNRRQRRLRRKRYYAAGVMEVWTIDQHDKWVRFGLFFHVGYDPFTGRIVWLRVWWTNKNPILIASYYLRAAQDEKGIYVKSYIIVTLESDHSVPL
jgi:hypothetical protein